ncbi:MAG TPA: ABC transporter permease [Anaerolineae bacterium]|nr:ABC transporter permease [Anaerolineae bacterium]
MRVVILTFRQLPIVLRTFFRQANLVFWSFGFFLLLQLLGCGLLAALDPKTLRPVLCSAVIALTLLGGGIYGVSYGMWNFFRGGVLERYHRSPYRASAVAAFVLSRFLVLFAAIVIQLVVVYVAFGVGRADMGRIGDHALTWRLSLGPLLVAVALADACFVLMGLCVVTLSRAHFQSYLISNLLFAVLSLVVMLEPLRLVKGAWLALPSAQVMMALEALLGEGAGWSGAWPHLWPLALWCAALAVVARQTFDWMVLDRAR